MFLRFRLARRPFGSMDSLFPYVCFLVFSQCVKGLIFIRLVCFPLCFEGAFFCVADPYVVPGTGYFVCNPPHVSHSKCCVGSFVSPSTVYFSFFDGGCSLSGMFHLVACLLAVCPCTEALCPIISALRCLPTW